MTTSDMRMTADDLECAIDIALRALSLEQKVALVSGGGFWGTTAIPEIGLRSIVFSDGPAGVRGAVWDERDPSLSLPAPVALGATWSLELAREVGSALASEARRKDVDVVLGPTLNLQRSPRGGRNHESFSEDPVLAGVIGSQVVLGLQTNGVGAAVKHFVLNDSETQRTSVSVSASERALREIYLAPFEDAVKVGTWVLMSAYNSVYGTPMTEHPLLTHPLVDEWGFDGVVISDWSAVTSISAGVADQHLAMPGPNPVWTSELADAVRRDRVPSEVLDAKIARILRLAHRVGAWQSAPAPPAVVDGRATARQVAARSVVMLKNALGVLPIASGQRICVIGHRGTRTRQQGGGSARVVPEPGVEDSFLAAFRRHHGAQLVDYEVGHLLDRSLRPLPSISICQPGTDDPGVLVRFHMRDGSIREEIRQATELIWLGTAPDAVDCSEVEILTDYTPLDDEEVEICVASTGRSVLAVDGTVVLEGKPDHEDLDEVAALMSPPTISADLVATRGHTLQLRLVHQIRAHPTVPRSASVILGTRPRAVDSELLTARAVELAKSVHTAVVVVGTSDDTESEGRDRDTLSLGEEQNALVERVAAANPRTIVVVNTGSPVLMPWIDRVAGVVVSWLGGEEGPSGLADVLFGDSDPSGRLPFSWPEHEGGALDPPITPIDGALSYLENLEGGYRSNEPPLFPFGFGLSYSPVVLDCVDASWHHGSLALSVRATNHGSRESRTVLQVYAAPNESNVVSGPRRLVAFSDIVLGPGESRQTSLAVPPRAFQQWDEHQHCWRTNTTGFRLRVGQHALDVGIQVNVPPSAATT